MDYPSFLSFVRETFPSLTPAQEAQFAALDGLYREWNGRINVISRKDIDNLYDHHVLHSLAIARYLQLRPQLEAAFAGASVLDLGTGGGFPGIPLAILFPGARFTLCDSVGKKTLVAGRRLPDGFLPVGQGQILPQHPLPQRRRPQRGNRRPDGPFPPAEGLRLHLAGGRLACRPLFRRQTRGGDYPLAPCAPASP